MTATDSAWSILKLANMNQLGRLMVIAANARTAKHSTWDAQSAPPGIGAVLNVVTSGPMDDVSLDSIEMIDEHFEQMKQLSSTVDSCNGLLAGTCPDVPEIYNPIATDFSFAELTFDNISDLRLRRCLQGLPTSLSLPVKSVDLLRAVAAYLLMNSADFVQRDGAPRHVVEAAAGRHRSHIDRRGLRIGCHIRRRGPLSRREHYFYKL